MPQAVSHSIPGPQEDPELLKKIREMMVAISRRSSSERLGSDIFQQCQRTMVELGHLGIMISDDNETHGLESLL